MNKQLKNLLLAVPVSFSMLVPQTISVFADNVQMTSTVKAETSTTYAVCYHIDGTDEVKEVKKTSKTDSQSIYLYSRPFQVTDTKSRLDKGYKWIGWSTKKDATEAEYKLGDKVTLKNDSPVIDLYSVYAPLDQAKFNVKVVYPDGTESDAFSASVTCKNWDIKHPENGYMHESTIKEVYEAALKSVTIKDGYKVKGFSSNGKTKELDTVDDTRIDFTTGYTYYIIVEKDEPTTYTVRYHIDGTDEVKEVKKTSKTDSQSIYLYSRPFQVTDTKSRLDKGYKWIGWSTKKDATEAEYKLGDKVTLKNDSPVIDLYSVYAPLDQAKFNVKVVYPDGTESDAFSASVTCKNWDIKHPENGYMHESTIKEVYEAALKSVTIKDGYKVKGFSSNGKTKELDTVDDTRIDFTTGYTYYIVVEKDEVVTPVEPEKPTPEEKPSTPEIKPDINEQKPSTPTVKPNTDDKKTNTSVEKTDTTKKDNSTVKTGVEDYALVYTVLALVSLLMIKKLNKEF